MNFDNYNESNFEACLSLFDKNCPKFFAVNERNDYIHYLKSKPPDYKIIFSNKEIIAAFGFKIDNALNRARLSWIIIAPLSKNNGIGTEIMENIKKIALINKLFTKFGAIEIKIIEDGWGKGMHRVNMKLKLDIIT
jgi:hypothetical protein